MSNPSATNPVNEAARARQACPTLTPQQRHHIADRAVADAMELADDIRQLDPQEVWGRLHLMAGEDPTRLAGLVFAAAAMLPDPDRMRTSEWRLLVAWTERDGAEAEA